MSCDFCGDYFLEEGYNSSFIHISGGTITVCRRCRAQMEKYHLVTGKYIVNKCKECGHIINVDFIRYKKRGRPKGSKNKIKKRVERPLDVFKVK